MNRLWAAAMGIAMAAGTAPEALAGDAETAARQRLETLIHGDPAPVSAAALVAVRDGRVVLRLAAGRAVIDPQDPGRERPFETDTLVRVASISKLSVALVTMMLVEQGRLALDTDLSDLLGFPVRNPHYPDRPLTVRMLLAHTSSLRDGEIYGLPVQHSLEELLRPNGPFDADGARWAGPEAGADRGPGAWFSYTNLNYGVLATVIERITAERFDVTVERMLFRPLGIVGGFDVRRLDDGAFARVAPVFRRDNGVWTPQVDDYRGRRPDEFVNPFVKATQPLSSYVPGRNGTTLSPQGGLRTSADGLTQLLRLFLGKGAVDGVRLLKPETLEAMLAPQWRYDPANPNGDTSGGQMRQWGLGVHCTTATPGADGDRWTDAADSPRLCGHFGEAYGLLGGLWFQPDGGWGFVYLLPGTSGEIADHRAPFTAFSRWEVAVAQAGMVAVDARGIE